MKILQLDLRAFGLFSDFSLDLSGGEQGLHLIYGRNEAGKSTALRALQGFLFGIHPQSRDMALQAGQTLQVGARLRAADGEERYFVRRKGNKDTLRDADGRPLPEAELQALLGGLSEAFFTALFGLDHERLVKGGEELLSARGEVGEALFGAGTGGQGLHELLQNLQHEAGDIFRSRASKPSLNAAIARFTEAKKALRQDTLRGEDWLERERELSKKRQESEALAAEALRHGAEKQRLERTRRTLPLLAKRGRLLDELREYRDAVLLPEGAAEQRVRLMQLLRSAEQQRDLAAQELQAAESELKQIQVPEALLAAKDSIQDLHQRVGAQRKGARELPGLQAQLESAEAQAQSLWRSIYPSREMPEDEAELCARPVELRIRELAQAHPILIQRRDDRTERMFACKRQGQAVEQEMETLPAERDLGRLKAAIARSQAQGDIEAQLAELRRELDVQERALADAIERLEGWRGGPDSLESRSIPAAETIDRFLRDDQAHDQSRARLKDRISASEERLAQARQKLDALEHAGAPPAEPDLERARAYRDQGWALIRRRYLGGDADAESELQGFCAGQPAAQAYESAVASADGLSDRLRREASRVAERAQWLAQREAAQRELKVHAAEQARLDAGRQALDCAWIELWEPLGLSPRSPQEMRAWLTRYDLARSKVELVREKRSRTDLLWARVDEHRTMLEAAVLEAGISAPTESLGLLLEHARTAFEAMDADNRRRAALTDKLRETRRELQRWQDEHRAAEEAVARWTELWTQALGEIDLPPHGSPAEILYVLDTIALVRQSRGQAAALRKRVLDLEREAGEFRAQTAVLASAVASDLLQVESEQAVAELSRRVDRAEQERARRDHLESSRKSLTARLEQAGRQIGEAHAGLRALMDQARCDDLDALPQAEQRGEQRRALEGQLHTCEEQLLASGEGLSLEALERSAESVDRDALPGEIQALSERLESIERERSPLLVSIGARGESLRREQGSSKAAEAAEELQLIAAEIRSLTEDYLRVALARSVLHRAMALYRERNQGPLLRRASDLFRCMTLGSFEGIAVDDEDRERQVLIGLRPNGIKIGVEAMSDGSRDQLYLALRLAGIEQHIAAHQPLPLVLDDILVNFDDERSRATLEVLSEISSRTQVLFFTHHAQLRDLARAAYPDALVEHELPSRALRGVA